MALRHRAEKMKRRENIRRLRRLRRFFKRILGVRERQGGEKRVGLDSRLRGNDEGSEAGEWYGFDL